MLNEIIKLIRIILLAVALFVFSPVPTHAQYYNYNGNVYNYTPVNITTGNATNITGSSAILSGLVNGNNLYSTYNLETWFQYGRNTNFEYATAHINSNSGYANFNSTVSNLSPNTIYYFRAVVQNPQGVIYGSANSFRTNFPAVVNAENSNVFSVAPAINTNPATAVSSRSAKLNSLLMSIPDNSTTWFEWGTSPNLDYITPAISLGSLSSAKHINTISGLAPKTTYYFRAVMQNGTSKMNGVTLSFTTNNATSSAVTVKNTDDSAVTNTSTIEPSAFSLVANVIGAGSFLPKNLFGWVILVILALILLIMTKHAYRKLFERRSESASEHV
ncbi:hypothetical protein A3H53_00750 [Candidatus Nomurabacteria bacterium RIFCSPLOWO2_02_FULL_40_10]|uniref:Fibronectin type-III domain-containing protein n=2 Tax=Candidatus Nomuraibacteriota TaxID=1752729 RepID=A0A1F6XY81_9BACT|nr:MAG: hypothetical protein A2642_05050 [Candidatus Nomurabacteria bacterium RIFCSPHIGHO2_01_FULL_39_10]OGI99096.1 MAG: hypothetical protein A3H53_00750 [Candidatus Nomurabacteria bacterium RIFCSPLOWO2_02_FULL_40_10]